MQCIMNINILGIQLVIRLVLVRYGSYLVEEPNTNFPKLDKQESNSLQEMKIIGVCQMHYQCARLLNSH